MMPKKQEKIHQINGIKIGFTEKKITSYGGFSMLAMFFEKIRLKAALNRIMPIQETSPNAMKSEEKLLGYISLLLTGASRFSHILYVGHPQIIKSLFGLKRLPLSGTTITRFFNKIKTIGEADQVSNRIWSYLEEIINWKEVKADWLSFDSTVITRYGNQEGAKKGYNPAKRGRASHHPIIAFLNENRFVINIWNRSGNTSSKNNIIPFFENAYNRIKNLIKIKGILADSGFYDESFINQLERHQLKYIITAKLYYTLQRKIYEHPKWTNVDTGLWISEFNFQHDSWKKSYRYIVVRQSIKKRKKALGRQLRLFEFETESYRYGIWITNMDDEPLTIWRSIRQRSNDENTIKELKEDLALCGFSMKQFYSTEAAFLIRILLYNLIVIFRSTFLPEKESRQRISTLRFKYFVIPANLGRDSNGNWIRLSIFKKKLKSKIILILHEIEEYSLPQRQLHCSSI